MTIGYMDLSMKWENVKYYSTSFQEANGISDKFSFLYKFQIALNKKQLLFGFLLYYIF